ncbi:hypothetical protein CMI47_04415 [Candidatus Pacearchaeota archaeon]|jgi:hypothetical protein|nr:hypothetical protein [Candidatus Pacearchaeota archaeon]|tara:strand:+ start:2582 stop:2764 length:183 start_codon:yes stop_codon:yes gene_type:complete
MPVELTDSAKRKLKEAERKGLLGKGLARRAADSITKRKGRNKEAMDIARRALAQSTDKHQ